MNPFEKALQSSVGKTVAAVSTGEWEDGKDYILFKFTDGSELKLDVDYEEAELLATTKEA